MNILFLTVPIAVIIGTFFVFGFLWAVNQDQFNDLETPSHRILFEDHEEKL